MYYYFTSTLKVVTTDNTKIQITHRSLIKPKT